MPAVDLARDREILNRAVREAGAEVLARFGLASHHWHKDDESPVSEADHAANDILYEELIARHGGHYGFLSEESADNRHRLKARRTWIVDPIDGTRAFLNGTPHFTVCVALIEEGKAILSAVYNPATDEFFAAERGRGATLNDRPITASRRSDLEGSTLLAHKQLFALPGWPAPWPPMNVDQVTSTSYRLALVAAGKFDAMITLLPKYDWDAAPGALIAEEAGAIVSDHIGQKFSYNKIDPRQRSLVCAGPNLYSHLLGRVSHLPGDFSVLAEYLKGRT